MGVTGFLRAVLPAAGTEVDLRQYRSGIPVRSNHHKRRRRPLRIGVDVSHWIYKACHRFGAMLADEKHLSNYGRYQLVTTEPTTKELDKETAQKYVTLCCRFVLERLEALQKETNGQVLAVLDGATPPIKDKVVQQRSQVRRDHGASRDAPVEIEGDESQLLARTKANRRAGAGKLFGQIVEELILGLRQTQIPFLVAPYEADGQLAYLSHHQLIDLVVTEDSDLLAQGGRCVLYKMDISRTYSCGEEEFSFVPRGILVRQQDLGAVVVSKRSDPVRLLDMSDALLSVVSVAADSDYAANLKGIGFVTACEIVQRCFLQSTSSRKHPLERVLELLFQRSYDQCTEAEQEAYRKQFLEALFMYRHPVVYCPFRQTFIVANLDTPDPELASYPPYHHLLSNIPSTVIGEIATGPMATLIAEGWVSPRTKKLYQSAQNNPNLPQAAKLLFQLEEQKEEKENDNDTTIATSTEETPKITALSEKVANAQHQAQAEINALETQVDTQLTVGNEGLQTQDLEEEQWRKELEEQRKKEAQAKEQERRGLEQFREELEEQRKKEAQAKEQAEINAMDTQVDTQFTVGNDGLQTQEL